MSRKPADQHPALSMGQHSLAVQQEDLDVSKLFHTDQWTGLDADEHRFLLAYVQYRDVRRAVEEMGPDSAQSMEWFNVTEKRNKDFAWCVRQILAHPKELAQHIMMEALCESAILLVQLMRNANPRVQLDAIKQLHAVAAIGGQSLMEGAGQYMNVQINMDAFTGELSKNGKVVDADKAG